MSNIKYVTMEIPGVSWHLKGAFHANMGKQQIANIFRAKVKRELSKRGLYEDDLTLVDFNCISDYLDITTMKLGFAKVSNEFDL